MEENKKQIFVFASLVAVIYTFCMYLLSYSMDTGEETFIDYILYTDDLVTYFYPGLIIATFIGFYFVNGAIPSTLLIIPLVFQEIYYSFIYDYDDPAVDTIDTLFYPGGFFYAPAVYSTFIFALAIYKAIQPKKIA